MKKALLIFAALFTMWAVADAQSATKVKEIDQNGFLALFDMSTGMVKHPAVID